MQKTLNWKDERKRRAERKAKFYEQQRHLDDKKRMMDAWRQHATGHTKDEEARNTWEKEANAKRFMERVREEGLIRQRLERAEALMKAREERRKAMESRIKANQECYDYMAVLEGVKDDLGV